MKCSICEREFEKNNSLKTHINRYHRSDDPIKTEIIYFNSLTPKIPIDLDDIKKMYLDGYTVDEIKMKYGVSVSNYIYLLGIKRTHSESKQTKRYKDKFEAIFMEKYGVKNPSQHETVKIKKKNTFLKNYGYENNFSNETIRNYALSKVDHSLIAEKVKKTMQEKYGEDITNPAQLDWVRKKISKTNKERMSKLTDDERRKITEKARMNINYVSKLEIRIQEILNFLNINYTANGFLYRYNWDLIFKNKKIIEIQGDFWHGNPKIYKGDDKLLNGLLAKDVWEKDERKLRLVESKGYKVYYLWESEINEMDDHELIKRLNEILC
jgi:G:T-mismatch repair DNA endonuclease (very short patch repair protein)